MPMNEKELRLIEYALNSLLSNWDEDVEDDLSPEGITFDMAEKFCRDIENRIEENNSRR